MTRVTGIGGIFFKAQDAEAMREWYKTHLGIPVEAWGGTAFKWREHETPEREASTTWSIFKNDSTYFGPGESRFMVNYRVEDLHATLDALRAEGVRVDDKVDESEYGKFGWVYDPEGNKIELWQPPDGM